MLFLIGINHAYQDNGFKDGGRAKRLNADLADRVRADFREFITKVIGEKTISLVAEESCQEILGKVKATITMAKLAADSSHVMHLYIEPESPIRAQLGIPCHAYEHLPEAEKQRIYRVREQYWLEQIQNKEGRNVLVICGHAHVDSFSTLLTNNGLEVEILETYWGKNYINA